MFSMPSLASVCKQIRWLWCHMHAQRPRDGSIGQLFGTGQAAKATSGRLAASRGVNRSACGVVEPHWIGSRGSRRLVAPRLAGCQRAPRR